MLVVNRRIQDTLLGIARAQTAVVVQLIAVLATVLIAAAVPGTTVASESPPSSTPLWKLTLGEYVYSGYSGTDVNLRWRRNDTSAWVGLYTDRIFGTQARAGTDTSISLGPYVQIQPSLQLATQGFVGGSLGLQIGGDTWYGLVGLGRTDGRNYFNLNFDPNDAVTLGAGHVGADGVSYLVFVVADNRFHTQQRDWHANVRLPFGSSHATLDLLYKSGLSDAGYIRAWGFSAAWEWPRYFVRLAYDPYQNFSAENAWRLAGGIRF